VLVVRQGWRAQAQLLAQPDADWTESLLGGANLSAALERAGERFEFSTWLATAVRGQWLKGVALRHD
jgi:hypothetical protein